MSESEQQIYPVVGYSSMEKTNPMRILDRAGVDYTVHDYSASGKIAAMDVAEEMGEDPEEVFKTLVTQGKSDKYYVFVLPATRELDLKKAAASVGEKSVGAAAAHRLHTRRMLPSGYAQIAEDGDPRIRQRMQEILCQRREGRPPAGIRF